MDSIVTIIIAVISSGLITGIINSVNKSKIDAMEINGLILANAKKDINDIRAENELLKRRIESLEKKIEILRAEINTKENIIKILEKKVKEEK